MIQFKKTQIYKNLSPEELKEQSLAMQLGKLTHSGALAVNTGKFTGRSPKDKFFIKENDSENLIDWNDYNIPLENKYFEILKNDLIAYLDSKSSIWAREVYAGASKSHQIAVTVINEFPDSNLFVYNMFIEPESYEKFESEWTIIQAPNFKADPKIHGTRQENFSVISLKEKTILIRGTGYTGEIKKGMFTVVNYILPAEKKTLTMHCSANQGKSGDVALFFGLSGTGKTTLSTDPDRKLIGDDEHAWSDNEVFNIEGGCYAKVIDLSPNNEPQIFNAIRDYAMLENVTFFNGTNEVNYSSKEITENTRVSYPLNYIDGAVIPSAGPIPKNIFFLTCDAFGVLPPLSKLNTAQAMFYFLSGYTAKIAGTEEGIKGPSPTFSTCFGAPFLPLSPNFYAEMLGKKITQNKVNVWMINTGWTSGGYGIGNRIKLAYTRALINAVLNNKLKDVITQRDPIFGLEIPLSCPQVPSQILNPICTWENKEDYKNEAIKLAQRFNKNFEKFSDYTSEEIKAAKPKTSL